MPEAHEAGPRRPTTRQAACSLFHSSSHACSSPGRPALQLKPPKAARICIGCYWVLQPRPDSDGNFGRLEAIDLATGRVAWTRRQRAPETASVLTTAGGLVFDGTRDRRFIASDTSTGKILWETRLNAVPSSTPISFSAHGQQLIAVVAGGGGAHEATWPVLTPEIENPTSSTTLWVFGLPQDSDNVSPIAQATQTPTE